MDVLNIVFQCTEPSHRWCHSDLDEQDGRGSSSADAEHRRSPTEGQSFFDIMPSTQRPASALFLV